MSEQPLDVKKSEETPQMPDDEGWQRLQESFAQLYQIKDLNRREYELVQAAKRSDIPLDIYRRLFEDYYNKQLAAGGFRAFQLLWKSPWKALTNFLELLSRLGWLAIIGVVITLSIQVIEVQEQLQYLGWAIVTLNQGQEGNGGRIFALENINIVGGNLAGLNVEKAVLPRIDLSDAQLYKSNLRDADLSQADLTDANLSQSDLRGAHLYQANLSGADLSHVNFQGADLGEVNLFGANLLGTQFKGANLLAADLRGTKNLAQANLSGAVYNEKTLFPPGFKPVEQNAYLIMPGAELGAIDLSGAALIDVNFEGANLEGANLENANLFEANLKNANLLGANLKQTKGLTLSQVKAAKNWEKAIYDEIFRQKLGLPLNLAEEIESSEEQGNEYRDGNRG